MVTAATAQEEEEEEEDDDIFCHVFYYAPLKYANADINIFFSVTSELIKAAKCGHQLSQ